MAEANVIFGSDALDTRVELYTTSGQYLHMRVNDLRSQRIAVAFDVSPCAALMPGRDKIIRHKPKPILD